MNDDVESVKSINVMVVFSLQHLLFPLGIIAVVHLQHDNTTFIIALII